MIIGLLFRKLLIRFLGVMNFFRRMVLDLSRIILIMRRWDREILRWVMHILRMLLHWGRRVIPVVEMVRVNISRMRRGHHLILVLIHRILHLRMHHLVLRMIAFFFLI